MLWSKCALAGSIHTVWLRSDKRYRFNFRYSVRRGWGFPKLNSTCQNSRFLLCLGRLIRVSWDMPTRLQRYYGDDHLHFLTWTCYHRQGWLAEPGRRDLFLHILEEARQRYRFVVVGYVVMPEHVHLLISEAEERTPSFSLQCLAMSS